MTPMSGPQTQSRRPQEAILLDRPAGKASPSAKLVQSDKPDGADRKPSKDEIAAQLAQVAQSLA